ncbi:polysaccharide biosynthesis tyrosine autokinase [Maribacter confluentis]|uniref:non-specific protein-tyrosine kinase n=1 Tax=Maribacter confluentis TaxID=1656093 RepID=A0ABT8RSM0_9FLAO|nr:polysaccharide biosynthesis tyrosine autokinase [Maribacter confluentis]MDO1513700.1 polysaccharide biosynthesis tyrosine autokinase [Maribacter confluentis]
MKESRYILDNQVEPFKIKEIILNYIRYWRWFIISIASFLIIGFLYIRYTPLIYKSTAKIKVIDDAKELDITSDPLAALSGKSTLNVENEIEILKSFRLLQQVVDLLNLDISYYEVGNVKTSRIYKAPFEIKKLFPVDSLKENVVFKLSFETSPPVISDTDGNIQNLDSIVTIFNSSKYPVEIRLNNLSALEKFKSKTFEARVSNKKESVLNLSKLLNIVLANDKSDILALSYKSESPELSEAILNGIISKFNQDGILDRQQVFKRTLEFIDERFLYLASELDSIEGGKEDFKRKNNLSYIESDAEVSIERKAETEDEVAKLQTQISLASVLKKTVINQSEYALLPVNIGLDNPSLTSSVNNYNQMALDRERLSVTVGESHPTLVTLSSQLERAKVNIIKTVNVYEGQLRTALERLNQKRSSASSIFSSLPEKEKMLRSIERQQSIKENLFLLLLQKREEAAINFAVTSPSIKIVDFALTEIQPISPKKTLIYPACLLLGLILPFGFLFIKFALDNTIKTKDDLRRICQEIPVIGEIPHLETSTEFIDTFDRSVNAESFRILITNINYILPKAQKEKCKVIYVTSTVAGEGKTQIAINLSLSYSSFNKKVLLLGADLRNPQLHNYFKTNKNIIGLSDYLSNLEVNIDECIENGFGANSYHNICFSGSVPPNSAQLLSDERFATFMSQIKSKFDYIIVDTAPTMLVADTLVISDYADVTLFVTRSQFTDKSLLEYSKEYYLNNKLRNMAYVLNDVEFNKKYRYKYGNKYNYGV